MKKILSIIVVIMVSLFFYSCGSKGENTSQKEEVKQEQKKEEKKTEEKKEEKTESKKTEDNPIAAMQKFAENVKKASEQQQGGKIEIMNEDDFTKVLPEVSGWKLENKPYYSKESMGSLIMSRVKADYIKGDKKITVEIKDTGSMSSLITPMKMALSMNFSHEDSNGYERVFEYKGEKGVEKYNNNNKKGRITLLVKSKYIIEIKTNRGVEMDELKNFLNNIDLGKLK